MYIYIYIYIYTYICLQLPEVKLHARGAATTCFTVPREGYAKRGSKKRLLLRDLNVT